MLNLNSVMIGTKQPTALAAFYEKILGSQRTWSIRITAFGDGKWEVRFYRYWSILEWGVTRKIPGA